jgi:alpha-D-xyloside xylohydrolase
VRSSQALAAPYPYVLYSDLYDHATFIKSVAKAGFSGLLWTPEVRDARTDEDLVRRLQAVAFSPMALINAWYIRNPPWMQIHRDANNKGQLAPDWERLEAACRSILELRMRFVPYLHAAFVRYHREGLPPFRALVMDFPDDPQTWTVDDQFMMGAGLMVAPVVAGQPDRAIYLPEGTWFDYWTGARHDGKRSIKVTVPLEQIPLFLKEGTLLPLADASSHTGDPAARRLTVLVGGDGAGSASVFEDDEGVPPALSEVRLSWNGQAGAVERVGEHAGPRYEIAGWRRMGTSG